MQLVSVVPFQMHAARLNGISQQPLTKQIPNCEASIDQVYHQYCSIVSRCKDDVSETATLNADFV